MTHTASTAHNTAIAIIGMGCVFPKSSHLKEFWHLIFNGIDAIGPIPEDTHWKLKDYFDQDPGRPDHTYCKRGGFLPTVLFDPLSYGIPPNNLEATDTSQLLGLEVAKSALEDAGYPIDHSFLKNHKVNVVLGVTGTQELVIPLGARLGHPIWKKALKDSGIRKEKQEEVLDRIQGDYVQWQENSFPGLLGNVIAGRIANRFNLSGTNTASDAACASSLSALHTAVMELSTGKCDMSITGGADTLNDIFMHMCFSKTGVLSHTSDARPFSKDADGTVLGEGIGMVVLKRLEDAKKDNDRIYAVIKSIGTSSDGRTSAIYAPDAGGQLKALNEAYKDAGIDPATVQLVEAHGTGTRVGDKVEFDALKKCFHPASSKSKNALKNRTAIGTVKSMIGHTKAAAGAAGIIKTALALHNKVLPPTLKATKPDPDLDIENSSFYLNEQSRPWVTGTQTHPRRSGVSAFGFGGSNFHAVLEEYNTTKDHVSWDGSVQIFAFSDTDQQGLLQQIKKIQSNLLQVKEAGLVNQRLAFEAGESRKRFKPRDLFRLAFVHKKDDDVLQTFEKSVHCVENKTGGKSIYFSCKKKKGKLGFLFPGQGSQYVDMAKELLSVFPEALDAIESADQIFGAQKSSEQKHLHDYIFAPPVHIQSKKLSEEQLRNTDIAQPAIGAVSLGLTRILNRFGVCPDLSCGHSFGELSALFSAGWIDDAAFLELAVARGFHMAQAGEKDGDAGSMLAVQAKLSVIEELIEQEKLDLVLANRNSPLQGVLSGETSEILKARKVCKQKKIRAIPLPVAAAFHSKLVKDAAVPFAKTVSTTKITPAKTNVLSNTTGKPYDRDVDVVKDLLGNQLANPVCFVDNIRHMANEQVTTFVEVGPKSVLTGLVQSILKGQKITALPLDGLSGKRTGVENLAHVLSQIAVQGFDIDLTQWEDAVQKPDEKKMAVALTGANLKPKNRSSRPKSQIEAPPSTTIPAETLKSSENKNRSKERGSGMTQNRKKVQTTIDYASYEAMKMVQQGLEAMQQLQTQTARAHEKFLDTQAQATRALAGMMDQTRKIAVPQDFSNNVAPTYQPTAPPINTPEPEAVKVQTPVKPTQPVVEPEPSVLQSEVPVQASEPEIKETPVAEASPQTQQVLFEIVTQLTGFPVEMLEPAMEIESDLGIDSIKKVEIISELEKKIPTCQGLTPENIGSVRTLEDICLIIDKDAQSAPYEEPAIDDTAPMEVLNEPAEQTGKADSHIAAVLVETISELTGFPVEMLEPSMNLESDLGIDSIKRVEILSKLEQQLDHIDSISPDDIGALKTIAEITDYLNPGDKKTGSKKKRQTQPTEKKNAIEPAPALKQLTRQTVALKEYPTNQIRFYNGAKIELPPSTCVYITKESSGLSSRLKEEFNQIGILADLIDLSSENIPDLKDASGIVLIPDAFAFSDTDYALTFLKSAFLLVKKNAGYLTSAGKSRGAFLSGISFLGGTFGFSDHAFTTQPFLGGLAGFIKTAGIELKHVLCRCLDMPDNHEKCLENAEAAASLLMTQGNVEMGIDGDSCFIPSLETSQLKPCLPVLGNDDVFVITGGAKGVTAACALELARQFSPKIALVGRSNLPLEEEAWSTDITEPATLKKAILSHGFADMPKRGKITPSDVERMYQQIISNRQIKENIAQMNAFGAKVKYFCADIRNRAQVEDVFNTVRSEFGPVTSVIHGAGVLEDKLIVDKSIAQFTRVLETKVRGLEAILSATRNDTLKHLVFFSSIAARTGNQGQSDYAIANEILNKTARVYASNHPDCKVLSVNWGPWEGGMVDPSLKKQFEKRGIDLIPVDAGARQLITEMGSPDSHGPEIVIGAHLFETKTAKPARLSKAMTITFSEEYLPVLSSHRIATEPVVPFAILMECHAQAAQKNNPGLVLAGMDDIRLLKGIRAQNPVPVNVNICRCRPESGGFEAVSSIVSHTENAVPFEHSRGTMRLAEKRPQPPVLSKAAFMALKPYSRSLKEVYDKILFHGPALQGIESVNGYSKKGIEIVSTLAPAPEKWIKKSPFSKWAIEPMMMDAAFQAAIIWTYETRGAVCLPSYIANLRLYASFDSLKGRVRILFTVNEETKNKIKGYFTFLDEENTVVASIMGFEAITDPSLKEKFKNKPLFSKDSILAFAQGKPSRAFGDKYKIFDDKKQIARLPRPPYFFMDRVLKADHPQWQMVPGGFIETQYDIPVDEWYFKANRTKTIPFCILLEIALQPCGWLAAYAGSALQSEDRLHFRNLGGNATLLKPVDRDSGTLSVRCRMKEVSKAGGMIIQDFDIQVSCMGTPVYQGKTNFGFFTHQALSNQVGIRNSRFADYTLSEKEHDMAEQYLFNDTAPVTPDDVNHGQKDGMPSKALLMVDSIDTLSMAAGLYNKGYIKAQKKVDPQEWFFDAHFYQDPVCPGSLGVESFLQMVRFFLLKKYDISPDTYEPDLTLGHTHEWVYRGQIIPSNKKIEVHAHIKAVKQQGDAFMAEADGALIVDGICIYEMLDFSVGFKKITAKTQQGVKKELPGKKV